MQRTPTKNLAPESLERVEKAKRVLSDSAPPNENEKRLKEEAEMAAVPTGAPDWAAGFFSAFQKQLTEINKKVTDVHDRLGALEVIEQRCEDMTGYIVKNTDDIVKNTDDITDLKIAVEELRAENVVLRKALEDKADIDYVDEKDAKITDDALRKSMTVCGVVMTGPENRWGDTKRVLANSLATLTPDLDSDAWFKKIERAHRGGKKEGKIPVIHCKYKSWGSQDRVMNIFRGENPPANPMKLEFYEKFHEHTEARRKKAIAMRKEIREDDKSIKAYVKYPAILRVKKQGELKYTDVAEF